MRYLPKNDLFLARLPEILANSTDNYRRYSFQAFANISGKFSKILNLQPYVRHSFRFFSTELFP